MQIVVVIGRVIRGKFLHGAGEFCQRLSPMAGGRLAGTQQFMQLGIDGLKLRASQLGQLGNDFVRAHGGQYSRQEVPDNCNFRQPVRPPAEI